MKRSHPQPICALTIAGSDSGGGAGIQADLKTFAAHGVLGTSAITAVTAQNTVEVAANVPMSANLVQQQIEVVIEDFPIRALKTGMLAEADIVDAVATTLALLPDVPLVIDPVLVSTSGTPLLSVEGMLLMVERLIPLATVVTPNLDEADLLLQKSNAGRSARAIADDLMALTAGRAVVVLKGGDVQGSARARDLALMPDGSEIWLDVPRVDTRSTHGTGCTFASSIAACLARGMSMGQALRHAKHYVTGALVNARPVGAGHGPLDHTWNLDYTVAGQGPAGPSAPGTTS